MIPKLCKVIQSLPRPENSAIRGLVGELQREVFALSNGVAEVEAKFCDCEVEVDPAFVVERFLCGVVEDCRDIHIAVNVKGVVPLCTSG